MRLLSRMRSISRDFGRFRRTGSAMPITSSKIIGILAVCALTLASCTGQRSETVRGARVEGAQAVASPSVTPGDQPSQPSEQSPDPEQIKAEEARLKGDPQATFAPAGMRCERYRDCIVAWVNDQIDWKCRDISPQENCQIPFFGYYHLASDMTGSVVFVAYHGENPTPAYEQVVGIPPLPLKGNFGTTTRFVYRHTAGVTRVTFQAILKDSKGQVVGRGAPQSFPAVP